MRLTRRGVAVLAAAILLLALGQVAGYPVLLALAAAALGALVAAAIVIHRRPQVAVSRVVEPDPVQRGRNAQATLHVRNPGTRYLPGFVAGDGIGSAVQRVRVKALAPGADAYYRYDVPTERRGRHQVGPLTVERSDALGLAANRLSAGESTTLWVHPRTYPMGVSVAGHPRHHHEGRTTEKSLRGSFDLREVREYVVGDDVRHLHWKAAARTGQLMVRDYADPDQPRFTVLLDNRVEFPAGQPFEEAVDIAASLIVSAARSDHRCRLATASGVDSATSAIRPLLDELCLLDRTTETGLLLVPEPLSRSGGGTLVVVMAGASIADLAALVAARPHYAEMYVIALVEHGEGPRVPGAKVLPVSDAADAARRWNTVVGR